MEGERARGQGGRLSLEHGTIFELRAPGCLWSPAQDSDEIASVNTIVDTEQAHEVHASLRSYWLLVVAK